MDRITSAIDDRYRAVATVAAPGGHEVAVEVEGNRFTAPIDVAPAAAGDDTASHGTSVTAAPSVLDRRRRSSARRSGRHHPTGGRRTGRHTGTRR